MISYYFLIYSANVIFISVDRATTYDNNFHGIADLKKAANLMAFYMLLQFAFKREDTRY